MERAAGLRALSQSLRQSRRECLGYRVHLEPMMATTE
jgi:hypothetical protein